MDAMPDLWVATTPEQLVWDVVFLVTFWWGWVRPAWKNRNKRSIYDLMGFNEPTEKELRAEAKFRMEAELREHDARMAAGFDHRTLKGTNLK